MAQNRSEQRVAIQLLAGMALNAKQIHQRLVNVHNAGAYSLSTVHRWMMRFATGDTRTMDRPRSGHPPHVTAAKLQQLQDILRRHPRSSLLQLARDTALSVGSVHRALKRLGWRRRPAKWVPHHLTPAQKRRRMDVCRTLLHLRAANRDYLRSIITMDESWFFCYDPMSKQSSSEWIPPGGQRAQIPRHEHATLKVMLSIFWDCDGVIMKEFIPDGLGIDAQLHLRLLRKLREKIRCHRPARWARQNWRIQQDNAPAHRARVVQHHLMQTNTLQVPHPGYSPDLAPSDFWLFNRIKRNLHGQRFADVDHLKQQVNAAIANIPAAEFRHAIKKLPDCWHSCIRVQGGYFE